MKFHGRMFPGRIADLDKPVEVRIHQPRKLAGVTIKIWELDAFLGADGKPKREGTPDDLLATFTGDIEPAPGGGSARPPAWRVFKVSNVKIEEAPADCIRFKLSFPGDPTEYAIPILSEVGEVEGTEYELGFSIEVGGAEKFRTRAPCLMAIPRVIARIREKVILGFDDDGEPIMDDAEDVSPSFDRVALGAAGTDDDDLSVKMTVLLRGRVHPSGYLIADADDAVTPLGLNLRRPLAAVPHLKDADPGQPPTALGLTVADDGVIEVLRPDRAFTLTMFLAGTKLSPTTQGSHRRISHGGDPLPITSGLPPLSSRSIAAPPRKPRRRRR